MKKAKSLLFLLVLFSATANATTRRVGFTATAQQVTALDYLNFQSAHDASLAGDTIQLYPGALIPAYSGTISKPLVIIGPGYLTNSYYLSGTAIANTGLQNLTGATGNNVFTIETGSAGTIIMGLNNITVTCSNLTTEERSNISIRRCRNLQVNFANIGLCKNWTISQCLNASVLQLATSGSFTGDRTISNLTIENSVLSANGLTLNTSPLGTYTGNKIINCVFLPNTSLSISNSALLVQNCIFDGQTFTNAGAAIFTKNITTLASTSNIMFTNAGSSGNQFSANLANIFVGYPTNTNNAFSEDGRFVLSASNIARNTGQIPGTTTATDCGVFGGSSPYKIAGIPPIPVFIRLDSPAAVVANGATNYIMSFSINSNN